MIYPSIVILDLPMIEGGQVPDVPLILRKKITLMTKKKTAQLSLPSARIGFVGQAQHHPYWLKILV